MLKNLKYSFCIVVNGFRLLYNLYTSWDKERAMKRNLIFIMCILLAAAFVLSACSKSAGEPPTEEELSADANKLVEELAAGDFSGAKKNHRYGLVMALLTGQKTLKTIWDSLLTQYGEYVAVYEYEYKEEAGFDNIIIKVAFHNKSIDFKVTYNKDTLKISGLHYSVNVDKPALAGADVPEVPVGVAEINFEFSSHGLKIPAILALPEGEGPYPLVILVHGSGPNNADESVGNQAPFRDIAWGLAQQGIAVLRYDKRTLVYPESFDDNSTVEQETVEDAVSAAVYAKGIPEVMPDKIFILGHSLGGMMIPRIAEVSGEARGFIMMAASVTPLHELMVEQYEYIFNLDGKLSIKERISLAQAKKMSKNVAALTPDSNKKAGSLFGVSAAYWLYLKGYDPLERAQGIGRPLLVIQGERDYQVPLRDFEALGGVLGGKDNVTLISYPGLGHLMTPAGNPPSPDDYYEELTVDRQVIDDIAKFVKGN